MRYFLRKCMTFVFILLVLQLFQLSESLYAQMTVEKPVPSRGSYRASHIKAGGIKIGPSLQLGKLPTGEINAIGTSFEGFAFDDNITENGGIFNPPNPMGAAGMDRLIAVVDAMIEARDKAGTLLWRSSLANFFATLAPTTATFNPKVVYDHYEDRFLVVALERTDVLFGDPSDASTILLAVSKTGNPATATAADWFFHKINSKINIGGVDRWADYPGFEVDEEVVYITANMFGFLFSGEAFGGTRLWIVDKGFSGGLYGGGPAGVTVHDPVPPGGFAFTMMPALVHGPGGIPGAVAGGVGTFLVAYNGLTFGGPGGLEAIQIVRVDDPLGMSGGPTFSLDFAVVGDIEDVGGIFGFPELPDAPQNGTVETIEVNDRRILDCVWRDNKLWCTTTIIPNSGAEAGETTAHWFQFDTSPIPGGPPVLIDEGNIGGEDIASGTFTFNASVAVNKYGDVKFGFSASSATTFAGAFITGRRPEDIAGTVRASETVHAGKDFFVRTFDSPPCSAIPAQNGWGEYSGISVDPADDRTFWVFNEYAELRGTGTLGGCNGRPAVEDGRWGTAWASSTFPAFTGTLAWEKRDETNTLQGGATFEISPDPVDGIGTLIMTDNDASDIDADPGQIKLDNVLFNTYTITETEAPSGYALDDDPTREQTVDGSNTDAVVGMMGVDDPGDTDESDFHNRLGSLSWEKRDEPGLLLGGASFSVIPHPFTGSGTLTMSDNDGNDVDLNDGQIRLENVLLDTYTITETAAPTGYVLDIDVTREETVNSGNLDAVVGVMGADDSGNTDESDFHNRLFGPQVTAVATQAGPLAQCDVVQVPIDKILVTIADDLSMVENADDKQNYLVVESGPDGDFATTACAGGAAGDDVEIEITSLSLTGINPITVQADLGFDDELEGGLYRLFVCDGITDSQGAALDGDGDSNPGGDFMIPSFRADPNNLLDNGHFDNCPVTLDPWVEVAVPPNMIAPGDPGTDDSVGSPLSASAKVSHSVSEMSAIGQCVAVEEDVVYNLDAMFRFIPVLGALANFEQTVEFFSSASCTGASLGTTSFSSVLEDEGGAWEQSNNEVIAQSGAISALIQFGIGPVGSNSNFDFFLDALFFGLEPGVMTGTITIIKDTDPNDPQDFVFADNVAAPNNFSLDDDNDNTLPNSKTFKNVTAGSYTITETLVPGFATTVACVDSDGSGTASTSSGSTATINLDSGETVTCTFTNTKLVNECILTPASDTNQVNTEHMVTVTVKQNNVVQQDVAVAFDIFKGPNKDVSGQSSGPTDTNGQATFTYTGGNTTGTDSIKASGTINGVPFECFAEKVWLDNQCTLEPETDQNQVGHDHSVTVTVTENGNPIQGVTVNFEVFKGPNSGDNGTGTTDASGQDTFTYTGDGGVGVDSIRASGTINGIPFECVAEKVWVEAEVLPPEDFSAEDLFPMFNFVTNQFSFDIRMKNTSSKIMVPPLFVQFTEINTDPPGPPVTIANADGGGNTVGAFYDYSDLMGANNQLPPNELTGYKTWIFNDPGQVNFTFDSDVLATFQTAPFAKTITAKGTLRGSVDVKNGTVTLLIGTTVDVDDLTPVEIPTEFTLLQNYPNPFNPETTIGFGLPQASEVTIYIYNLQGQLVRRLIGDQMQAGSHEVIWDARDDLGNSMTSGVYLYRIKADGFMEVRKLMLIR